MLEALAAHDAGLASVADVQEAASAAAGALDNANAELRRALERLDPDLEEVQFVVPASEQPAAVARLTEELRRLAAPDREQPYCDWCYGPMTESARQRSEALGLDRQFAWACEACLAGHRYREPPDDWGGRDDDWPFRER